MAEWSGVDPRLDGADRARPLRRGGTNVCVLSTVLGAIDLGYRIVVVSDGALQFG